MILLNSLYGKILRIRSIEERIAARYPQQQMRCPIHLSIGQEAVAVGVSACLNASDKVYSTHRAHAHYLAKGGNLNRLIAELYGKASGCTSGRGGSMHLTDLDCGFMASTAIVANSIPLAVGHALHQQLTRSQSITVSYFGDGAIEEGAFYESVNFAVLKSLPVLFICENNFYSVYSPLSVRQAKNRSISGFVKAFGLPSIEVDGNDVELVYEAIVTAVESIKSGKGPVFIEFKTYRHREHCGPSFDDDLNYRPQQEIEEWKQKDPLVMSRAKLAQHDMMSEKEYKDLLSRINLEIDTAFELAMSDSFPLESNNQRNLYAE